MKAILLLQMGGPCCTAEIQNFLNNLFNDKYIIQLPGFLTPFQKNLAEFISTRRAPKVAVNYEMIGGRSPILFETQCQAKALEKKLGSEYKCFIAMRYSYPYLKDTLQEMWTVGVEELTVIPLYPQYSTATSGSSIIECKELFSESCFDQKAKINYIESWHDNPAFIELISRRLITRIEELLIQFKRKELQLQKAKDAGSQESSFFNRKIQILFSAHGLPVKYIENGDPYQKQVEDSVNLVVQNLAQQLGLKAYKNNLKSQSIQTSNLFPEQNNAADGALGIDLDWGISYQSRVGPVKWLEPNTEDLIKELGDKGCKNLIIVPISFVGDHIETLHELGIEYREVAYKHGIENYSITRLPKANPLLIEVLASVITRETNQNRHCEELQLRGNPVL